MDSVVITSIRFAPGYDANIQWEETETFNVGLDYVFINGRINGSLDFYVK
jgi:iron complex outermembrane receptor protein